MGNSVCHPVWLHVVVSSESEALVKQLRLLLVAVLADLALKWKRMEEVVAFWHSVSDKHLGARSSSGGCSSSRGVPSLCPRSGTASTEVARPTKPKTTLI